ncbi:hypothetical protein, partial [Mycobacterium tuberculosis]|uniref:hypothetical protein n=1 Tax=Mycobacterium tuberculosis TaxID=1773 RepID=UPI001F3E557E
SRSSGGYLLDEPPDMTPSFPRTGVSGHAGAVHTGVGAALGKGAPVIVVGHVYTSEYEDRDGIRRSSLEMRATSVGPDLSRVIVRIEKPAYTGPSAGDLPAATGTGAAGAADAPASAADSVSDVVVDDAITGHNPLPISA